ncbi:hypothetical protein [Thiosulfativibrio zosterae]|nr:hypothetical protein [Thiosulfativibrio zosterae]
MNFMQTQPSVIKILGMMLLTLLLWSCGTPTPQETIVRSVQVGWPEWILKTPEDSQHFYAVSSATVENNDVNLAYSKAVWAAQTELKSQMQLAIKKIQIGNDWADSQQTFDNQDLEAQLRSLVRQKLTPDKNIRFSYKTEETYVDIENRKFFVLVSLAKSDILNNLNERANLLESQLKDYKHAIHKGSTLAQLMSLSPVLPTLEELKLLNEISLTFGAPLPPLKKQLLADLMNDQITRLFSGLVFSVDALTAETEKLELALTLALQNSGLTVSARRPDLLLKYYIEIETEIVDKSTKVSLDTDIEMINRDSSNFENFNRSVAAENLIPEAAQANAFDQLAIELKQTITQKLENYVEEVNRLNYGR